MAGRGLRRGYALKNSRFCDFPEGFGNPGGQILDKIKKFDPIQVHMAPFEPIFNQNRSHGFWEASGMPPGL